MELRQLRYLVALARDLNFTTAAARSNVAQPALSKQIQKLEEELGTVLVDRTSRRVQMTTAGRKLVERAVIILDEVDAACAEVAESTQLLSGHLAIGTTQTPGPLNLARLLSDFHVLYPAIELAVREELSLVVAERLRADEIELGFVAEIPEPARHGLELRMIASEPLVIALPVEHRLARRKRINFNELSDEAFVLFPEGATIRASFDGLAQSHGFKPHVAFVTTDTARMCELVALGLGVSFLPESDARRHGELATLTTANQAATYSVYLARRRNRSISPAAAAMASLVERAFAPKLPDG